MNNKGNLATGIIGVLVGIILIISILPAFISDATELKGTTDRGVILTNRTVSSLSFDDVSTVTVVAPKKCTQVNCTIDESAGTITLKSKSQRCNGTGNVTYNYQGDGYQTDSTNRSIISLILVFGGVALLYLVGKLAGVV